MTLTVEQMKEYVHLNPVCGSIVPQDALDGSFSNDIK